MAVDIRHLTGEELDAGLGEISRSPADGGVLQLIVRRPSTGERESLQQAQLDPVEGLVGDNWKLRTNPPNLGTQLTLMNARVAALVAQDPARWHLAGDQLYVDLDLSEANLPSGTRLAIGSAVIEVSPVPHNGCAKFVARFGAEAMKFVNRDKSLHLRGINARVVQAGSVRVGDTATKATPST